MKEGTKEGHTSYKILRHILCVKPGKQLLTKWLEVRRTRKKVGRKPLEYVGRGDPPPKSYWGPSVPLRGGGHCMGSSRRLAHL